MKRNREWLRAAFALVDLHMHRERLDGVVSLKPAESAVYERNT